MDSAVHKYLSRIGSRGGKRSRRRLDPDDARDMVRVREARRAFRRFRTRCFWSYSPSLVVALKDVDWVAEQLMKHGGRDAWEIGAKLCR